MSIGLTKAVIRRKLADKGIENEELIEAIVKVVTDNNNEVERDIDSKLDDLKRKLK